MAKGKHRQQHDRTDAPVSHPVAGAAEQSDYPVVETEQPAGRFTMKQYVLLNLIFDAFCIVQLLFVRVMIRETRGLYFFFALLMIGMLLVSIFDYVYDRVNPPEAEVSEA